MLSRFGGGVKRFLSSFYQFFVNFLLTNGKMYAMMEIGEAGMFPLCLNSMPEGAEDNHMEKEKGLSHIAELLARVEGASFHELPDLGLYMDQVTGYLNKPLCALALSREEAPLTPSMINNYVKGGHISRPTQKKYSREQLAALYMLCSLKNALSITDAAALIYFLTEEHGMSDAYNRFVTDQKENAMALASQFADLSDTDALADLALELSLRASSERIAAEALIAYLVGRDEEKIARARAAAEKERLAKEAEVKAQKEAERQVREAAKAKKEAAKAAKDATKKKAEKKTEKKQKTDKKAE